MTAFGSQPGNLGPAGIPIPPPPENNEQQLVDDIHALRVKVVDGATNFRQPIRLAANGTVRVDMQGQRVNSVILTAATGVLFGYLFDVSSNDGKAALLPDFAVSATVVPTTVQVLVPERDDYVVGIQEGAGAAATGVLRATKV